MAVWNNIRKKASAFITGEVVGETHLNHHGHLGLYGHQTQEQPTRESLIYKAVIPRFLYKPPFGYPRFENLPNYRRLAQSPYIEMCVSAIVNQVCAVPWDIVSRDSDKPVNEVHAKEVKEFLENPNVNEENLGLQLRKLVRDILIIDSGVFVKVYNAAGEFKELYVRDGATFTKNPDIFGTLNHRADLIPLHYIFGFIGKPDEEHDTFMKEKAAYYQYGWITGARPMPFGRKEIIYIMENPLPQSIYGQSRMSVLEKTVQMLIYGEDHNLDYFIDNNVPKGVISLLDAEHDQVESFKQQWGEIQRTPDEIGNFRRRSHSVPFTTTDVKFERLQFSNAELELLEQQKWFLKLVWAVFGVTPTEMGMDDSPSRAHEITQSRVFKRRTIRPLLTVIEDHLNSQLIWSDFHEDVKLEFKMYDIDEDIKKHALYGIQLDKGIKTPNEIRAEIGIEPHESDQADQLKSPSSGFGMGGGFGQSQIPNGEQLEDKSQKKSIETKPFAEYSSFQDCVNQNADKENPRAFCAAVEAQTQGKQEQIEQTRGENKIADDYKKQGDMGTGLTPTETPPAGNRHIRKISKEDANYRLQDKEGEMCGGCKFFVRKKDGNNGCQLVEGFIDYEKTCDFFVDRGNQSEAKAQFKSKRKDLTTQNPLALGEGEIPLTEARMNRAFRRVINDSEEEILRQLRLLVGGEKTLMQIKALDPTEIDRLKKLVNFKLSETVVKEIVRNNFFKGFEDIEKDLKMNFIADRNAINALETFTFENVKGMESDISNKLRQQLTIGFRNGEGIQKLSDRVSKVFDVAEARAEAIARTEITRAANEGRVDAIKKSGLDGEMVWVSNIDDRTSAICKRLDGKTTAVGENFKDATSGFEGQHPPAHVNCRSSAEFRPKMSE